MATQRVERTRPNESVDGIPPEMLAVLRRMGSQRGRTKPRIAKRRSWTMQIEVIIDESMVGGRRARSVHVETLDISGSGMGFVSDCFINRNAIVTVDLPVGERLRIEGYVVHCTHLEGTRHRVGVKFLRTLPTGR